jgi:23S rRNA (cytidine1920-2'-O)/16S rRNA (cytidine1409-2'-O)-methyltransferase
MKKEALLRHLVSLYPDIGEKELYARILCGEVLINGERVKDPERYIPVDAEIGFQQKRFVSRGGEKLDFAMKTWDLDITGMVFIDAGCSTGGFTQVLLHRGASHVHAVDVGYNQLDYTLRSRTDVSVHERTNIMDVTSLEPAPHAAVADLSFRSVVPVIPHLISLVAERWLIALVKPQFEWKTPDQEFNGVIRSADLQADIVENVIRRLWKEGAYTDSLCMSPITGRKGNREIFLRCGAEPQCTLESMMETARGTIIS